mgnify:CR=1 FL=1
MTMKKCVVGMDTNKTKAYNKFIMETPYLELQKVEGTSKFEDPCLDELGICEKEEASTIKHHKKVEIEPFNHHRQPRGRPLKKFHC